MNTSRAMTIIETLAVVTIITILGALSVPVYNSVKHSAKIARSESNLRQIGISMSLYRGEWEASSSASSDEVSSLGLPPSLFALAKSQHLPDELFRTGGENFGKLAPDVYTYMVPHIPTETEDGWKAHYEKMQEQSIVVVDTTQNPGMPPNTFIFEPQLSLGLRLDGGVTKRRATGSPGSYAFWEN